MASRKRWDTIYSKTNPFTLPQNIAREVKSIAHARRNGRDLERMQYLWIYVTPVHSEFNEGQAEPSVSLATDEWLSILDESASIGTECLVISTGEGLDEHPEILAMCSWAQEAHEMLVGVHIYDTPLTRGEVEKLKTLDQRMFGLFVDAELMDRMPPMEDSGIDVFMADCDGRETMNGNCTIPENMACVGPTGKMYACGYVYGSKKYAMGDYFEKELGAVMSDEKIPRMIPRGDGTGKRRCNGCPPLMQRMLEESTRRGPVSRAGGNGKHH